MILLAGSGLVAGLFNAVAGGGTFFTFSALLAAGVPPISANATSAVALVPGSFASTFAYRSEIRANLRHFASLCLVSAIGGGLGALLLLQLENATFRPLVPWLLLAATLLFAAGPVITKLARRGGDWGTRRLRRAAMVSFQFLVALYGGFFGAGIGIMMLAALTITEGSDFHRINSAKNLLSALLQIVAVSFFIAAGVIDWLAVAVIGGTAIVGGYGGVAVSRRINPNAMRWLVVAIGLTLTAIFLIRN